jgi:ribosomal protein L7/L12
LYKEADALGGIVTYKEVQIGLYQGKLEAVKEYKNRTGYPLLEAKRIVEKYFEDHNLKFARS